MGVRVKATFGSSGAGRRGGVLVGAAVAGGEVLPGLPDPASHWPLWDVRVCAWGGRQAAAGGGALYAPGPRSARLPPFAAVLFAAFAGAPAGMLKMVLTAASLVALPVLCGSRWPGAHASTAGGGSLQPRRADPADPSGRRTPSPGRGQPDPGRADRRGPAAERGRAWWQGIGNRLAAGIKLSPLIFVGIALTQRRGRRRSPARFRADGRGGVRVAAQVVPGVLGRRDVLRPAPGRRPGRPVGPVAVRGGRGLAGTGDPPRPGGSSRCSRPG